MKHYSFIMACAMACLMASCNNATSTASADPNADNAEKWTADQRATIESIKAVDGSDGHLFEMTYTADYKLDTMLAEGCGSLPEAMQLLYKQLLPESRVLLGDASTQGVGCSTFSAASSDGGYVLGRNYDYPVGGKYYMVVKCNPKVGYKSIGVADLSALMEKPDSINPFNTVRNQEITLFAPYSVLDGINETGFMCSFMQLEYSSTMQNRGKTKLLSNWVTRLLLDKCKTVEEGIALMDQYDMQSIFQKEDMDLHYILADAQGDRAIVEYVDNEMHVLRAPELVGQEAPYVLSTNFYLTPGTRMTPEEGLKHKELGYWRFDVMNDSLKNNPTPSIKEAMDYMRSVRILYNDQDEIAALKALGKDPTKFESWSWMTLWSSVYSSKNLSLDLCIRENYDKKFSFKIDK